MIADPKLMAARARSVAARAQFLAAVDTAKARLSPASLASDAVEGVKAKAGEIAHGSVEAARQRPGAVAAAVVAVGLILARRPIGRAVERLRGGDATPGGDAS